MSAPAKFLFDLDFAETNRPPKTISLADHASRVAEAEAEAYRKGFSAAEQQAAADNARHAAAALSQIGALLTRLAGGLRGVESRLEAEAVEVAVADRARALRRDRGAGVGMLPPPDGVAARGGPH